ncbi:MAG TPA: hypothetical protein VGI22_19440 [Xanthobacteraceae bacterium]
MLIALMPMALVSHVLVAATGLPSIDIQRNCRESSAAVYGNATADVVSACVEDEKAAAATLTKDWSTLPAADKARCVHTTTFLPSYVEWLTCIEQEGALRRIHKDNSTRSPGG